MRSASICWMYLRSRIAIDCVLDCVILINDSVLRCVARSGAIFISTLSPYSLRKTFAQFANFGWPKVQPFGHRVFFVGGGKRLHPLLPKHTNTPHHAHPSPPFSPSLLPSFPSPSPPLPLSSPLLLSSLSPLTPPPSSLSAVALNHHQACILFSSRSFLFWEIVKTSCRFWWDVQNLTFSWKFNLSTSGPELSERTRSSDHFLLRNHRKLIIRCGVMIFLVFSICDLYNVDSWFRDISTSCIHGVEISTPWVCMVQRHVSTLWIHIVNLHLCTTDSRC